MYDVHLKDKKKTRQVLQKAHFDRKLRLMCSGSVSNAALDVESSRWKAMRAARKATGSSLTDIGINVAIAKLFEKFNK